ncbi:MAG TPA: hypothetical protein VJZ27_07660, partial [Aggregatilineales bacterium]|nr:hypothetical protein [Aggregatilineales bacterium]
MMQAHRIKGLRLPRLFTDPVASGIDLLDGLEQQVPLFISRQEFDTGGQFHIMIVVDYQLAEKPQRRMALLPTATDGVSAPKKSMSSLTLNQLPVSPPATLFG